MFRAEGDGFAPDSSRVEPSASDEVSRLRLTEMFSAAARQFWKHGGYDKSHAQSNQLWGYFSHYNRRLRRCLIQTRLTTLSKENGGTLDAVNDALEGIDIATASNVDRRDASVSGDDVFRPV